MLEFVHASDSIIDDKHKPKRILHFETITNQITFHVYSYFSRKL